MSSARGKLSRHLPAGLRPAAQRLGLERWRIRHALADALLRGRLGVGKGIQHVHGPARIGALRPDEMIVLCAVRNGLPWVSTFIRYYQRQGARHVVFLDNGSTDGTPEAVTAHAGTSLFRTELPFSRYSVALKRWLVRTFGGGGWSLYCDVDELFDYPFSESLNLPGFLGYLNEREYTAVTAQMLDMFSAESLGAVQGRPDDDLQAAYRWYDIEDIVKTRRKFWIWMNRVDTGALYSHSGGVRARVFDVHGSKLTKHPLTRSGSSLRVFPYDEHFVTHAALADVSGVLLHYKFIGALYQQACDELQRKQHTNFQVYRRYQEVYTDKPELLLWRPNAREYERAEDLLESGFLIASERYRDWVAERGRVGSA